MAASCCATTYSPLPTNARFDARCVPLLWESAPSEVAQAHEVKVGPSKTRFACTGVKCTIVCQARNAVRLIEPTLERVTEFVPLTLTVFHHFLSFANV